MFPKIGVPKNGWFIMENPIKNGWFGGKTHYFRKHPYRWVKFHPPYSHRSLNAVTGCHNGHPTQVVEGLSGTPWWSNWSHASPSKPHRTTRWCFHWLLKWWCGDGLRPGVLHRIILWTFWNPCPYWPWHGHSLTQPPSTIFNPNPRNDRKHRRRNIPMC